VLLWLELGSGHVFSVQKGVLSIPLCHRVGKVSPWRCEIQAPFRSFQRKKEIAGRIGGL